MFVLARSFARASLTDAPNKNKIGGFLILTYVASQSLVAFDWVMSLEYPWVSTLFGAYFFIESTYAAIGICTIFCFFILHSKDADHSTIQKKTLKDAATFLFGFSLFWAGMFFAQYLTIWYGNLPEEVLFIHTRITTMPFKTLGQLVLLTMFFIPFVFLFFTIFVNFINYPFKVNMFFR